MGTKQHNLEHAPEQSGTRDQILVVFIAGIGFICGGWAWWLLVSSMHPTEPARPGEGEMVAVLSLLTLLGGFITTHFLTEPSDGGWLTPEEEIPVAVINFVIGAIMLTFTSLYVYFS